MGERGGEKEVCGRDDESGLGGMNVSVCESTTRPDSAHPHTVSRRRRLLRVLPFHHTSTRPCNHIYMRPVVKHDR